MKKSKPIAILCAVLPISFTIFGGGHFYLGKKLEGTLFLIAGLLIVYSSLLYLPDIEYLFGQNFFPYIAESEGFDVIPPLVTLGLWFCLIVASILRVRHFLK